MNNKKLKKALVFQKENGEYFYLVKFFQLSNGLFYFECWLLSDELGECSDYIYANFNGESSLVDAVKTAYAYVEHIKE